MGSIYIIKLILKHFRRQFFLVDILSIHDENDCFYYYLFVCILFASGRTNKKKSNFNNKNAFLFLF